MSFGGRNSARFKTGSKKERAMQRYTSGEISYDKYIALTTPRVGGVKFSSRMETSTVGKQLLEDSFSPGKSRLRAAGMALSGSLSTTTSTPSKLATSRNTAAMTLGMPPSREAVLAATQTQPDLRGGGGGGGRTSTMTKYERELEETKAADRRRAQAERDRARDAAAAALAAAEKTKADLIASAKGPYDLQLWREGENALPPHQLKVMAEDKMYTPDPMTGIARWPIPGMQGSRTPWMQVPYGSGPDAVKERTSEVEAKRGVGVNKPFRWKEYESTGMGGGATQRFRGKDTAALLRVQRSYEQSGMMSVLLPGQAEATRQKRVRRPGELPVC